jgi:hypothetical protein
MVSLLKSHVVRKILLLFLVSFLVLVAVRSASASWTSTNWAGYAINSAGVTAISASWTVPEIQCANTAGGNTVTQGVSVWIGFDGLTGGATLIPEQVGTTSLCFNGNPSYYAWEEDPTVGPGKTNHSVLAFYDQLSPGDHITASIAYLGNNQFRLTIADSEMSNSRTYTVIVPNAPRASAEWIVEAFTNINTQSQVTLPTFRPITFSGCSAAVNNAAGSITQNNAQPIDMVDNNGNIIVTTQNLNQAGTSFQVAEVG